MKKKVKYFLSIVLISIIGNFNLASSAVTTKKQAVLEVVVFTVNKHVKSDRVGELAYSVTSVLKQYPGFISREFGESNQTPRQYVDVVKWKSLEDANYAAQHIVKNEKMSKFIAIMTSYKMYHFKLIN